MPLHIFAKNLRHRRLHLGLYQRDVARILGLSGNTYQHWERGRCWPQTHQLLLRLCDILQVTSIDKFIRCNEAQGRPRKRRARPAKEISN